MAIKNTRGLFPRIFKSDSGGGGGNLPIATTTSPGIVQPDGETINVDPNGVISAVSSGGGVDIETTETVVGTYYNKPLYARVYERNDITQFTSSVVELVAGLQNVDKIYDIKIDYKLNSAQGYGRKGTWTGGQPFLEGTSIHYAPMLSDIVLYNIEIVYIIVFYTKTTD